VPDFEWLRPKQDPEESVATEMTAQVVTTSPAEQEEQEEQVATEMMARVVTMVPEAQEGPTRLT
jgi:hypothetical protein